VKYASSTTYGATWTSVRADLRLAALPADMLSVTDLSHGEEFVTLVQGSDIRLLWPMRLTVERDSDGFVVSDDLTGVYGEGETRQAAIAAYREALVALRRVLTAREDTLSPDLMHRLEILRSIVPPGE